MNDKVKNGISIFKEVASIGTILFAVYIFIGKSAVKSDQEQRNNIALINQAKQNKVTDSIIISRFDNLSDTMKMVILKQNIMISKQVKADKGIIELYRTTGNTEKLINWLIQ